MKNRHPKLELARKLLTPAERARGVKPFDSKAWIARKEANLKREIERAGGKYVDRKVRAQKAFLAKRGIKVGEIALQKEAKKKPQERSFFTRIFRKQAK